MNFLCDLHIPLIVCDYLSHVGHTCIHLSELKIPYTDAEIAHYADTHQYTFITKDANFCDDRILKASPKSYIIIKLLNISYNEIIDSLNEYLCLEKA